MLSRRIVPRSERPKPPKVAAPLFLITPEGTELMGSAIRVAEDVLLSCSHCLERYDEALKRIRGARLETIGGNMLTVRARDPENDLVLLQANKPLTTSAASLVFQTGKPSSTAQLSISGYPGRFEGKQVLAYDDARILLTGTSVSNGSLYDFQFTGGLADGVSGAAVFNWAGDGWRCVGMARLGRMDTGQSRGIGAGLIVSFLEAHEVHVTVVNDNSPSEPVKSPDSTLRAGGAGIWWWISGGAVVFAMMAAGTIATYYSAPRQGGSDISHNSTTLTVSPPKQTVQPAKMTEVKIVVYNGNDFPKFTINGKVHRADQYEGGVATFHLASGSYDIKAEYEDRVCEAVFSVPETKHAGAQCNLK